MQPRVIKELTREPAQVLEAVEPQPSRQQLITAHKLKEKYSNTFLKFADCHSPIKHMHNVTEDEINKTGKNIKSFN